MCSELTAYRRCEQIFKIFVDHAQHCSICKQADPNPESCDPEQLCTTGRGLRENFERSEINYNRTYGSPHLT